MEPNEAFELVKKQFPSTKFQNKCTVVDNKILFYGEIPPRDPKHGRFIGTRIFLFDIDEKKATRWNPAQDLEFWRKVNSTENTKLQSQ